MTKPTREEVEQLIARLQPWLEEQDRSFYVTDISRPPTLTPNLPFEPVPPEVVEEFRRITHFFPGEFACLENLIRSEHHQCLVQSKDGTFAVIAELSRAARMLQS